MADHAPLPPINFAALADALLARADQLLPDWLPGGVKRGHEYVCGSVYGGAGSSCSVNTVSGLWSDFQSGEAGKDLISLYAAGKGIGMGAAAVAVAREEGLEDVAGVQPAQADAAAPRQPRPVPVQPASASAPPRMDEGWATVMPVPANAPAPTFKHGYRQPADLDHTAVYSIDGNLYGYVVRFRTSDGGKETLPYTWCTSARDGASKWHWRTWDEPRPLYFPGGASPAAHAVSHPVVHGMPGSLPTVVLVEGEKKAGILQALLDATAPGVYLVASWPGGCKAWKRSDWRWLAGCAVLAWPDCDAKREPLTRKERDALDVQVLQQLQSIGGQVTDNDRQKVKDTVYRLAQGMKPLLPAHKQPGMAAMLGIGALLRDAHACTVQMLPIPEPLAVPDGWDCADAINTDGWDGARVLAFFGQAQSLPAGTTAPVATPGDGDAGPKKIDGLAEAGDKDDPFYDHLMFMVDSLELKGVFEIGVNRKLVIAALRKAPALRDCLGYNELTGAPSTRVAWPWRPQPGPLKDTDDLALGDWLCDVYKLKPASRATLSEAIETVADQRRFHPIRDWLKALEHDGKPRLDKWLIYVLGMQPDRLPAKRRTYLQMVGRFLLLGLVARVMQPGCKFDYSPVFEGLTGRGKSTFVKTLVGAEFFSDTHFDIGNGKDGFEQLEGLWGYELSELTALRKADSEQVKQFFSSTVDRFRGAYGKYVQVHPRQCVIFCSTNKKQYLYDLTGNRRFWPIWIDQPIKLDWLAKYRDQLFAEAYALFGKGERYAPTLVEEEEFFIPEQKLRLVETAVQSRLYELLTREGSPKEEGKLTLDLNQHLMFVTLDRLVSALGADAAKSSSLLEGQIRGWLEAHGWTYGRESTGQRRRGYRQPDVWPPVIDDEDPATGTGSRPTQTDAHEGSDDEPF